MEYLKVSSQKELDEKIAAGVLGFEIDFDCSIKSDIYLRISGTSAPSIVSRESSAPRIVSWGSSAPRIESRESSAPSIESWESSAPSLKAFGYCQVRASGKVKIKAFGKTVCITCDKLVKVCGGIIIRKKPISSVLAWCNYYGVEVKNNKVVLFKSVGDDYQSPKGGNYTPKTIPVASDWDGGKAECGGGLHFSPHPKMAREFNERGTKFVACPIAIKDFRKPKESDDYPHKIKARGCCAPVWECDCDGNKIA
jgi:hypothetical protein